MATLRGVQDWGKLAKKFNTMGGRDDKSVDPRFFVPGKDSEGNIAVTIRFLPSPNGEAIVEESRHWFAGPVDPISGKGEVYNEACPRAVRKKCPACDFAGKAWGDGDKDAYKKWGNKSKYVGNILVINDVNKPENNGKVFLFRFGQVIWNMIDEKMAPKSKLQEPVIVFSYETGANFNLIGVKNKFNNGKKLIEYDDFKPSIFVSPAESILAEDVITAADAGLHDMVEWDEDNYYKSLDELKTKLSTVMKLEGGVSTVPTPVHPITAQANADADKDMAAIDALVKGETPEVTTETPAVSADDDNDAIMARLNALTS